MKTYRSEHAANVALQPQTLQAMRNLSALQSMRSNSWNVGRTFMRPVPIRPAAHTVAQKETLRESVNACSREIIRLALAIVGAVGAYLVLTSF